jgi:hypothetical protein
MRRTLGEYSKKASLLISERSFFKQELQRQCNDTLCGEILFKVHSLNQAYYLDLKQTKDRLFNALIAKKPTQTSPRHNKKVITIPEDLQLTSSEESVLAKGLKFVPTKPKVNDFELKRDLEAFYRRIKLHAHFNNANRTIQDSDIDTSDEVSSFKKFAPKSTWSPMVDPQSSVHKFITSCRAKIDNISALPKVKNHNLTKEEQNALKSLHTREDVVIKPADKGGAVVVWRKDLYIKEVNHQLENREFYTKLENDNTSENAQRVKETVLAEIADENLPKDAEVLIIDKPRCSQFYVLPKVHKPGNPGRPIVSACCCPTERISAYVNDIIHPLVTALPSYIRDSSHAIEKVKDHTLRKGENPLLFTMDVKSLYSVIPHVDGLAALKHYLNRRETQDPPTSTVLRLAELVLTLNTFQFGDDHYQQEKGVAMGTRMGPTYANLFLGWLEEKMHRTYDGPTPELYERFIDDIFGVTQMGETCLLQWVEHMKGLHPAIKFTVEISDTKVSFLDAEFSLTDSGIISNVFYKTTDSHSFLQYESFHPQKTKDAIPYSQFLRLRRLTSRDEDFETRKNEMMGYFTNRDYPRGILKRAERRVQTISQDTALESHQKTTVSNKIPFVTTYHPSTSEVVKILKENWSILKQDPETSCLFEGGMLLSQRKNKNLKDLLVRTRLNKDSEIGGTFPCNRSRCLTCSHANKEDKVIGETTWYIKESFQCTTQNLVYAITCSVCGMLYIGETKRKLAERFREHRRDVVKNNRSSPVAIHFNTPNHSVDDMLVGGLVTCVSDKQRKAMEMRIIANLNTMDPNGMNFDFTYNV